MEYKTTFAFKIVDESFQTGVPLTVDNESGIINFIVHGSSGADKNKRVIVNRELFRHVKIYFATTGKFSI